MSLSLNRFSPFLAVLLLAGCSYIHDKEFQTVHIDTPGAVGAKCHLEVDDIRYPVYAPESVTVPRTKNDMKIDCRAPGNRRKKAVVPPRRSVLFWQNLSNGFLGAPLDLASGAAYEFPDYIQVSFYDVQAKPYNLPLHEYNTVVNRKTPELEELLPSQPLLNKDRNKKSVELKRREPAYSSLTRYDDMDSGVAVPVSKPAAHPVSMSDLATPDHMSPNSVSGSFNDDFSRFSQGAVKAYPVE